MTADTQDNTKSTEAAQRPHFWKKAVVGISVVVIVAVAWRAVYVSNQHEMYTRRSLRRSQQLYDALLDVPGRRFSTVDVRPAAAQKKEVLERYG